MLCHKRLSAKHQTPDCKKSNTYSVKGCFGSFHYAVSHYQRGGERENESCGLKSSSSVELRDASTSTTKRGASQAMSCAVARPQPPDSDVYLCVVLELIKHAGKSLQTYAFLDQGFPHIFL